MSDEIARANAALLARAADDSRLPCDCNDCDGAWCAWCLDHHGRKPCPFEEAVREETTGAERQGRDE